MKSFLPILLLSLLAALAVAVDNPAPPAKGETVAIDSSDDNLSGDAWVKLDSAPVILNQVQPLYPQKDKEAGITGKFWVKLLINKQGLVRKATILKREGGSDGLAEAALAAARQWTFHPAMIAGKPAACWVTTAVVFTLADKPDSTKTPPARPK
jgi:TonB family protein